VPDQIIRLPERRDINSKKPVRNTRLGRFACRLGLHKRAYIQSDSDLADGTRRYMSLVLTYCERPGCLEPIRVVNEEVLPKLPIDHLA
jgi:hypothetical protein